MRTFYYIAVKFCHRCDLSPSYIVTELTCHRYGLSPIWPVSLLYQCCPSCRKLQLLDFTTTAASRGESLGHFRLLVCCLGWLTKCFIYLCVFWCTRKRKYLSLYAYPTKVFHGFLTKNNSCIIWHCIEWISRLLILPIWRKVASSVYASALSAYQSTIF